MNCNKKKILVVGRKLGIGGVEKALVSLLNSFDLEQFEVDFMLMIHEGELLSEVKTGINILPGPKEYNWLSIRKDKLLQNMLTLLPHPLFFYAYLKHLIGGLVMNRMAQARQYMWQDCIDAVPILEKNYYAVLDFTGLFRRYVLEKTIAEIKYTWIHSDYRTYGYNREIDKSLLTRFDNICCVGDSCKRIFLSIYPDFKSKTIIVRNIIDTELIKQQALGIGFTDKFDGIRLLDITRIDPNKGLDIAVKVCNKLKERGHKFRWYILGNDALGYKQKLEKLIVEKDVQDCFILLGFSKNPYPFMKQCDIIVHFSRYEGRSVAIDEAMSLCKPILLTNYESAKDQISSGKNGIICEFDIDSLVNQLSKLILDKDYRMYFSKQLELQNFENTKFKLFD